MVNSNIPSSNPLLTTQISSQRLIRKADDKNTSPSTVCRSVLCYAGLSCCAAIGIIIIALVIYNTVTTVRLQDELREMRNRLDDWIMEELNDEDLEAIMEIMANRNEDVEYNQPDDNTSEKTLQRSARSVNESPHGIPMNDKSYAAVRQRTNSPADAIIEDLLLNKPATTRPTMVYDWTRRQKRFHSSGSHLNDIVDRQNSEHVQNRAGSWAMSTTTKDRSKAFRQIMTKSQYEQWQAQNNNQHNTPKRVPGIYHKSLETGRQHAPLEQQHRVRTIIAVHYGAVRERDSRKPSHVRNIDWQPSKWVNQLAMDRFFQMDNGAVRVRKSGLYQVYAQITFEQRSSPNGFIVAHNSERFLECQTSTQSSNSCYTSRVVYMQSEDQILLSDMFADQRVVLHEGQSFFGLMKLGQVQDRSQQ